MRKNLVSVVVAAGALQVGAVQAQGWEFFPARGGDYHANPIVSVIAGQLDPHEKGADAGTVTGIELSMNCFLLAAPGGTMRQQLSYAVYDKDNVKLSTIELNPHYMIDVADNLQLGFGPGIGYVMADTPAGDDAAFALQLGGSAGYRMGALYLGAEARWQWAGDAKIGGESFSLDNNRVVAKVGYAF